MIRRKKVLIGAVACALALAACSSNAGSDKGSASSSDTAASLTSPSTGNDPDPTWDEVSANTQLIQALGKDYPLATGSTTRGINGNTLSIGCNAAESAGGAPNVFKDWCQGAEARLKAANSAKETSYQFKIVATTDNGSDPQNTDTTLTDAVDNKDVFAMMFEQSGPLTANILEQKHVPYFGDFVACGASSVFGYSLASGALTCPALPAETNGKWTTYTDSIVNAYAKANKITVQQIKYAAVGTNIPAISTYLKALVSQLKSAGANIVYQGTPLPANAGGAVDLNPYVVPVLNSKPSLIGFYIADPALQAQYYGALKNAGYKGGVLAAFTQSQLENPATAQLVDGGLDTSAGWGFPGFGGPAWAKVTADAKAVGASTPVDSGFYHGWIAADEFVAGLKDFSKSGKQLTSENFVNFLNQGWKYPGFGTVTSPTIYPYGKYGAAPCSAIAKLDAKTKTELPYQNLVCGKVYFAQN